MLLQVLLLAVQIKRDSQGRLIRVWTVGAVSPFERAGAHGISPFDWSASLIWLFIVCSVLAGWIPAGGDTRCEMTMEMSIRGNASFR